MEKKKILKPSPEEIKKEIDLLAKKAAENVSQQFSLFLGISSIDEDIDSGFDVDQLKDVAEPEESYRYYYGIRSLLIANLPKGPEYKKMRQYIYDEKNLFLNRGKDIGVNGVRGSDGRMTYIQPFLKQAFSEVIKWIESGANPYDIYDAFRLLNQERNA